MPTEVIATVQQIAAFKRLKGRIITDKDGNVIDDTNDMEDYEMTHQQL